LDILRNQMLIFRYKALFGFLFAVILHCATASLVEGGEVGLRKQRMWGD